MHHPERLRGPFKNVRQHRSENLTVRCKRDVQHANDRRKNELALMPEQFATARSEDSDDLRRH